MMRRSSSGMLLTASNCRARSSDGPRSVSSKTSTSKPQRHGRLWRRGGHGRAPDRAFKANATALVLMAYGRDDAGERAAAIQSLLGTAKLDGLVPLCWLTDPLGKLPTCPNSELDSLLPFPNSTES